MLSEKVRRIRLGLQELYVIGQPLNGLTVQLLLFALVELEDCVLDAEERAGPVEPAAPADNIIPFPHSHQPRINP